MVVTVFRSRVRPGLDEAAVGALGARMAELAEAMPGFVSHKDYASEDGEFVTIVEFESQQTQEAWRRHAEHAEAQRRGREEFFAEYRIQVCEVVREMRFPRSAGDRKPQ